MDEAHRLNKELLLFKVDFKKAYNSIDWRYLDSVMGKMSFPFLCGENGLKSAFQLLQLLC